MELVLNSGKLESVSLLEEDLSKPLGFLNSQYKSAVEDSLRDTSSRSIFGLRRRIKNSRYNFVSGMEIALKLSVFLVAIIAIFN
ncbi:hypothetical protein SAMN05421824_1059 [Hyunsoonleella jejuensis]|uniref:Uncharacterized protein n=1 Tax=Hyunsoonleella jejuensis TaxID=419940 RepID=A0A1H9CYI4_9FLAO|nr:hypothetical protein [Hyunsoonleella jejuensis]SEQ06235.1 hypothetical protein SAMN05421824_1059 [Hyunsoonleella jejuensis]